MLWGGPPAVSSPQACWRGRWERTVPSARRGRSRSEVSRIAQGLDGQVEAFRTRPLEGRYPYLFLDGKVEKVRDGGRVVRKCVVIAHGVHDSGRREVIGLDVGEAETEAFWRTFLRGLVKRGLLGVQLAISDAHPGLKAAIAQVLGCPWQRCTVHFLRDCLGHARREQQPMLAALIRPIFNQDNKAAARDRLSEAIAALEMPSHSGAAWPCPRRLDHRRDHAEQAGADRGAPRAKPIARFIPFGSCDPAE